MLLLVVPPLLALLSGRDGRGVCSGINWKRYANWA
jgi:hypothetical protein